ncbi:MAG: proline dehydrogenase family protein [Candidatus Micrarchaeota archaeon]
MLTGAIRAVGNLFFLTLMSRWVAGATARDAVRYCAAKRCIINYLGEHYTESRMANEAVAEYKRLVDIIRSARASASMTIKPSQFGFDALDIEDPRSFCEESTLDAVSYASAAGIYVWLDMEGSRFTDFTLGFYKKYASAYPIGVCLQANLKRTPGDLEALIAIAEKVPVRVRLVKGIYREDARLAIPPEQVHRRFLELIRAAFEKSPEGFGIAVGSHHSEAIGLAMELQKKHRKRFFEIEVLKGVLPSYYAQLRARGVPLAEYVPYGKDAFAYSVRRARENPAFARSILFSLFFDAYKKLYG